MYYDSFMYSKESSDYFNHVNYAVAHYWSVHGKWQAYDILCGIWLWIDGVTSKMISTGSSWQDLPFHVLSRAIELDELGRFQAASIPFFSLCIFTILFCLNFEYPIIIHSVYDDSSEHYSSSKCSVGWIGSKDLHMNAHNFNAIIHFV